MSDASQALPIIEVKVEDARNLFGIYRDGELRECRFSKRQAIRVAKRLRREDRAKQRWRSKYKPGEVVYRV